MTVFLLLFAVLSAAVAVTLGFFFVRAQEKLTRYDGIQRVEDYMNGCQRQAQEAQAQAQQLEHASAQTKLELEQLRQQLAKLQRIVGSFRSLAEVETKRQAAETELKELANLLQCGKSAQEFAAKETHHRNLVTQLQQDILAAEDALNMQEFGIYHPRYDFGTSDGYKAKLEECKRQQKSRIKEESAWECPTEWTVDGSRAEGIKKTKEQAKLMLRAFNGECDVAIAKVRYNNANNMENRINKAFTQINKLGTRGHITLLDSYRDLKLQELFLAHELAQKKQEEKEEAARVREEMREQEKVAKEIEASQKAAEKEATAKEKALEQARKELAVQEGANTIKMQELVARLENELKEVLDRKAKAIARAQLTRSGHVYVLSNVGVFGDGVYKIGLTRRLDPHERVRELSSASVPFVFDTHAIIYSEDAPALERKLHEYFSDRRVNLVNHRKEFFRVSLAEIRAAVEKVHGMQVSFVLEAEAEEYHKTCAMLRERQAIPMATA